MSSQVRARPSETCERRLRICCEFALWPSESHAVRSFVTIQFASRKVPLHAMSPPCHIQLLAVSAQRFPEPIVVGVRHRELGRWRAMWSFTLATAAIPSGRPLQVLRSRVRDLPGDHSEVQSPRQIPMEDVRRPSNERRSAPPGLSRAARQEGIGSRGGAMRRRPARHDAHRSSRHAAPGLVLRRPRRGTLPDAVIDLRRSRACLPSRRAGRA